MAEVNETNETAFETDDGLAIDPLEASAGDGAGAEALRRASALMARNEPALRAIPEDRVLRPRVGRAVAWGQTLHVLEGLASVRSRMAAEFSASRVARVEEAAARLKDDALVLAVAELRRADALAEPPEAPEESLSSRVRRADQTYLAWAEALASTSPAARKKLEDIRSGRGARDDAEDVLRLVAFLRPFSGTVSGVAALTPEALDAAEADATLLLDLMGAKAEVGPREAQDLVNRAYTAWHTSYVEVVRAGRDLTFGEPDSLRRFPLPSGSWGARPAASRAAAA